MNEEYYTGIVERLGAIYNLLETFRHTEDPIARVALSELLLKKAIYFDTYVQVNDGIGLVPDGLPPNQQQEAFNTQQAEFDFTQDNGS